ncbi:PREDICTED: axial regulator YABBY 4 isoform X3 [Brassica oleracea var. oleracea]|uniref:axial regulator YABBY 4 isoform X3 n=1 Tax=Brassica oleracea var. oleracea TaxID=109376 RepID=UPI0006A71A48|nr:PREDICTED: axial regulator YABBY 4 isoform X3 [Brassica oleracea var. oleracea]
MANMTTLNQLFDLPGQICHVQCGFCTTILLVSVPFTSLSMVVTVRCGHCTSLLSVNLMKASFIPLHLLTSLSHLDEVPVTYILCTEKDEVAATTDGVEEEAWKVTLEKENSPTTLVTSSDNEDEDEDKDVSRVYQVVNKPPEKRQRAPSAYNCFIKEEIRRLKAQNPSMAHKEAFSLAAKNFKTRELPQINVFVRKTTMCYYHAMLWRTMR